MKTKRKTDLKLDILIASFTLLIVFTTVYLYANKYGESGDYVANIKPDLFTANLSAIDYTPEVAYTGAVGEETNDLVDEMVDDILDNLEGESDDEIAENIETAEKDIEDQIKALNEELLTYPDNRETIKGRKALLKNLHIRLRLEATKEGKIEVSTEIGSTLREAYENGFISNEDAPFKDTKDEWFAPSVALLKEVGIVNGYKDEFGNSLGEYRPDNNVTHAEIIKMGLVAVGKGEMEGQPNLSSALDHWAKGYVKYAESFGATLVKGDLKLDESASRGNVIRFLLEAMGMKEPPFVNETHFSDVFVHDPNARFIQYAYEIGLVTGDPNGTFRPNDSINRAEAATLVMRIIQISGGKDSVIFEE